MSESQYEKSRALFIRRWGEMAAGWGISRTMAEIHALLFLSNKPLCTDDLMEVLQVSRGNASMNVRQLIAWGLVHREHRRGDRREYFVAEADVWQMFETISRERRRREIEPIVETIGKCREMLAGSNTASTDELKSSRVFDKRLTDMQEFFTVANSLFNAFVKTGQSKMGKLLTTLAKI